MDQRYEGNVLTTLRDDGSRIWMRPKLSLGRFLNRRRILGYALIFLFLVLPFVKVGGHPALLFDVLSRRFHFFGVTFHPTDTVLLMFLMLSIFLGIFWITALFGRVWCGWGCPQTVYMELLFRPIERLIEGGPSRQRQLDGKTFSGRRWFKYGVFLLIAFILGNQFLAYFVGWERLAVWMTEPPTDHLGGFSVMAVTTALVFFDFGYFREQMCTVICPYARFQSALLDRQSLIVGYDKLRGEARRKIKARKANDNSGDCIDCRACVTTCPTGIDIRDGLQLECIACTQCIDACDTIMDKVGKPRGLIRLSSQHNLETKEPTRILRPRVILYPLAISLFLGVLVFMVSTKAEADVMILRVNQPFTLLDDGEVRNLARVKIVNRTEEKRTYNVEVVGLEEHKLVSPFPVTLEGGKQMVTPVFIDLPSTAFQDGKREVEIVVTDDHGFRSARTYKLQGPD